MFALLFAEQFQAAFEYMDSWFRSGWRRQGGLDLRPMEGETVVQVGGGKQATRRRGMCLGSGR